MKLRGKFNSMLLVVFGLGLGASGYFSYQQLNENARAEVLSNASVLMETILSARTWAVNEVGPNLRETEEDEDMLMMGVPAYAADKVMEAVKKRYPEYDYREAALNPTNVGVIGMIRIAATNCTAIEQYRNPATMNRVCRLMNQAPNGAPTTTIGTQTHQ